MSLLIVKVADPWYRQSVLWLFALKTGQVGTDRLGWFYHCGGSIHDVEPHHQHVTVETWGIPQPCSSRPTVFTHGFLYGANYRIFITQLQQLSQFQQFGGGLKSCRTVGHKEQGWANITLSMHPDMIRERYQGMFRARRAWGLRRLPVKGKSQGCGKLY